MKPPIPWLRVFVEGVVIVGSILLAFGIEAAWQERQEREEEGRLLVALRDEFEQNLQRVEEARRFHEEVQASTLKLMELSAARPIGLSTDSVQHLLGDLSWWSEERSFSTGALNAVLQGGKLPLIRNEELQRALAGWQTSIDYVATREVQDYETFRDVWMPFLRGNAHLSRISNQITRRPGTTLERESSNNPVLDPRVDASDLLGRLDFHNVLLTKQWVQTDVLRAYDKLEGELQAMIALIGSASEM